MDAPEVVPQPPERPARGSRWLTWVFLAMVASPALVWVLPRRPPAPPPSLPAGWTRLAEPGLSVDLPAEPVRRGPNATPYGGTGTTWLGVADGYSYMVARMVGGLVPPEDAHAPDDMLTGFCDGLSGALEPECSTWQPATVSGRAGRELRYRGPKSALISRAVQVDRTLYLFVVGAPTPDAALDWPDVAHFLDSVRLAR